MQISDVLATFHSYFSTVFIHPTMQSSIDRLAQSALTKPSSPQRKILASRQALDPDIEALRQKIFALPPSEREECDILLNRLHNRLQPPAPPSIPKAPPPPVFGKKKEKVVLAGLDHHPETQKKHPAPTRDQIAARKSTLRPTAERRREEVNDQSSQNNVRHQKPKRAKA